MKALFTIATFASILGTASVAQAADENSQPVAGGYDVVAYQTEDRAVRGTGMLVSVYKGETYLFSSEANKKTFDASPDRYVPAYGGWCAFGVSVGKKFHTDPTVFAVVDGTTYLNLSKDIQKKWEAKRAGNIQKANKAWPKIRKKSAAKL